MESSFSQQFRTILTKNVLIHIRSKTLLNQIINIFIVIAIIIVINKTGNGSSSQQQIPFYMSIAIMLFCRSVALNWVAEKQSRQTQVQKIMGISNGAYYMGWIVFNLINGLAVSLIFIGVLAITGLFSGEDTNFGEIFGLYFLYLLASFSFVLFLCSFFSDAVLSSQIITFIQLLSSLLYFLVYIDDFSQSSVAMQLTALFPSIAFEFTIMTIGLGQTGVLFETPFTESQGYITLGALTLGYFILFVYLSLVMPNQNGSNLHPLFFLKCKGSESSSELENSLQLSNISSARYCQEESQEKAISMYIKNLTKRFDEKLVVNQLSLTLFQGETYCLLGHNGAGKSTTINMLTGILKPDSGTINILGYDYEKQLHMIRNKTGVCLQTDVLYDYLTVRQHVEFYADLKGIQPQMKKNEVNEMIQRCGLENQQFKKTKELSGGNKRKTCLACASIGNSKLIFLDQPSSGLDPNSRRVIWGLIDSLRKQGRTIILTTHHLQQAEALANRIGFLAHGQMLAQGSCSYIKQRFGCGYYLEVALDPQRNIESQKTMIREKVKYLIKGYRQDDQVNVNSMRFLLPINQKQFYSALFSFLEQHQFQFSLNLSSLEDIFIKIGMDADSILNNQPLPELQKVIIPDYKPTYTMSTQVKHVFLKKFKTSIRSPSVLFSILLPVTFIVVGIIISLQAFPVILSDPKRSIIHTYYKHNALSFFMCLAFAFNTASYCGFLVKERQIQFKYLSYVMGMKKSAYWVGTILFDFIQICIPYAFIYIVISCFPVDQRASFSNSFDWLTLTLVMFSLSFIPFCYLWNFAFQKSSSAFRFFPFIVFLGFYVIPVIPLVFWPSSQFLQYLLPIISPLLCLNSCMLSRQMIGQTSYALISIFGRVFDLDYFTQPFIWYPLVIFSVQSVVLFTLVILVDDFKFNLNDKIEMDNREKKTNQSEDLLRQKNKIKQLKLAQPIIVDQLYKKYPNGHVAIRDNSFVVQNGQTFGLLGPNGAGKSTTFNILTAAIPKTSGKVLLHGKQVNKSVDQIFSTVGVCPQFNPLFDQMTTAQHIDFFAGIKGMSGAQKQQIIDFYMKNLQLQQYRDVQSHKLSGGNKRKLCIAMSLVGNPSLIFLDEPSAGVDPIARRYIWNVLHSFASMKDKSFVLTTHSINEAESLCSRIGILIKGQFYCLGTPRELKQRYGKGYRATVSYDSVEKIQEVKKIIGENFSNFNQSVYTQQLRASFQFAKQNFIFSKAFDLFYNDLLKENLITEFQISETSLEEVFIYLSRMQLQHQFDHVDQEEKQSCCWGNSSKR